MDAETQRVLDDLAARLTAIEERLERGRQEFAKIRSEITYYAQQEAKHDQIVWDLKRERNRLLETLYGELNAVAAEVNLLSAAMADLTKRMDDHAQRPSAARKASRRRTDPDD